MYVTLFSNMFISSNALSKVRSVLLLRLVGQLSANVCEFVPFAAKVNQWLWAPVFPASGSARHTCLARTGSFCPWSFLFRFNLNTASAQTVPAVSKLCPSASQTLLFIFLISIPVPMPGVWTVFFLPQLPWSGSMCVPVPCCHTVNLICVKLAVASKVLDCGNCCHNWDLSFLLCDSKYCNTILCVHVCFTLESSSQLTVVGDFLCSLKGSFRLTSLGLSSERFSTEHRI